MWGIPHGQVPATAMRFFIAPQAMLMAVDRWLATSKKSCHRDAVLYGVLHYRGLRFAHPRLCSFTTNAVLYGKKFVSIRAIRGSK